MATCSKCRVTFNSPDTDLIPWYKLNRYINSLDPTYWYKMDELAGSTLANSGSAGASDINVFGTTVLGNPTGLLSDPYAVQTDGVTSYGTLTTVPNLANATVGFLINVTGSGVSGFPTMWTISTAQGESDFYFTDSNKRITAVFRRTQPSASFTESVNNTLVYNVWQWIFLQYSETTKRSSIFIGKNGVASEASYVTQSNGGGAGVLSTGTAMRIWSYLGGGFNVPALTAQFVVFPTLLSLQQMTNLTELAGV